MERGSREDYRRRPVMGVADLEATEPALHDFVTLRNDLGVGQVSALRPEGIEVTYFESVVNPVAKRLIVQRSELRQAQLEPMRRCYVRHESGWLPGRVDYHEFDRYRVSIGGRQDWVEPADLRVRWDRPLPSAYSDLLAPGTWAHPAEVELRRAFLESCADQRRAAGGLTAAGSVVAEPHAHQLEIARRVLDDPVGRFLLADEVGLGKTIETLFVIRQFLVDDPEASIRIVVPRHLVGQWKLELLNRAFIDTDGGAGDFPHADIDVIETGPSLAWKRSELDLLVIDEAHGVAAWANSSKKTERVGYARAKRAAEHARCVLLLSATPSLQSSRTFLALLHLVDPSRHDIKQLGAFEEKLAHREAIGSALLALDPDDPPAIVADSLRELARALPVGAAPSTTLEGFATELEDAEELGQTGRERLEGIRHEVAEAFRVDRRMLRTRRALIAKRFPVRGRARGEPVHVEDSTYVVADEWFERWRTAVLVDHGAPDEAVEWIAGRLANATMYAPGLLASFARMRSGTPVTGDRKALNLRDAEITVLQAPKIGPEEAAELAAVPEFGAVIGERCAEEVAEHIWIQYRARDRVVVMAGEEAAALELARALKSRVRTGEAQLHLHGFSARALEDSARRFESNEDPCHVLICDSSAEEGLNLQSADVILMLDLPLAANQIEQRLGRADRFGRGEPVKLVLVEVSGGSHLRDAWQRLLGGSYQIFERSIAALQVPVAETLTWLRGAILNSGAAGIDDLTSRIAEHLAVGEREIARSDLLDSVWNDDEGKEIAAGLTSFDESWHEWQRRADKLIGHSLQIIRWHHSDDIVSYWLSHDRVQRIKPKIDGRFQAEYFVEAVSHSGQVRKTTYDRSVALAGQRLRLMRTGDHLVDAVERYLCDQHDERVATIWRRTQRLPDDRVQLGFTLHFRSRADLPPELAVLPAAQRSSLLRRLDLVLLPQMTTVVVSSEGVVLPDDDDLAFLLSLPFDRSHGDTVLRGTAASQVRELFADDWEAVCHAAHEAGLHAARQRTGVTDRDAMLGAAEIRHQGRLGVLRGRDASADHSEREIQGADALARALETADVRLEAATVVVVSRDEPPSSPAVAARHDDG